MLKKAFLILFIILIKFLFAQQTKNESLIQFYIEGTLIAQPLKLQSDTPLFSGVTFIDMFSARKFTSVHLDHAYGTVELNTLWVVRLAGWQVQFSAPPKQSDWDKEKRFFRFTTRIGS